MAFSNRVHAIWALLFVLAAGICQAAEKQDRIEKGFVQFAESGDRIRLAASDKVSDYQLVCLRGTDAPETGQRFRKESTDLLEKLVRRKNVEIRWSEKDSEGRIIADVYVNKINVNEQMLRLGMTWHDKKQFDSEALASAEREAREAKRGIWSQENPVAPWDFRANKSARSKAIRQSAKAQDESGDDEPAKSNEPKTKDGYTWVNGYTKKNGTSVRGHWRRK